MSTIIERILADSAEGKRELKRQKLLVSVSEQIWEMLEREGITCAELAKRLNTSSSNVSQMLSGRRNLTLKTLVDITSQLRCTPEIRIIREDAVTAPQTQEHLIYKSYALGPNRFTATIDTPKFDFEKWESANDKDYPIRQTA